MHKSILAHARPKLNNYGESGPRRKRSDLDACLSCFPLTPKKERDMTLKRYVLGVVLLMLVWTINASAANPIIIENGLTGTRDWQISDEYAYDRQIEGYADKVSINIGGTITFLVNLRDSSSYDLKIYRMGWYNGYGGRLIYTRTGIPAGLQDDPEADHQTGLAECAWTISGNPSDHSWTHPGVEGPPSGYYLAKIITISPKNKQFAAYIPFTVRDDARVSDFLFQASVTTWQAYNYWPRNSYADPGDWRNGKSLYAGTTNDPLSWGPAIPEGHTNGRQARAVSFDRPYSPDGDSPYYTSGQFFIRGEYNMVRWIEKEGYDVTYTTDVDTDAATDMIDGPLSPGRHKVFLSVGHDEYWSWQMRDNIEQARNRTDQPLNIGWFGANNVHWQIRFEPSSYVYLSPGIRHRRNIVAYKSLATSGDPLWKDPYYTPVSGGGSPTNYLTTTLWRNMRTNPELGTQCPTSSDCFKYPEDEIVGVMTNLDNPTGRGHFTFATLPSNFWVTRNVPDPVTPFAGLVGYEADEYQTASNNYPGRATTLKIADSEFVGDFISTRAHAVYYTMNSGARVFAVGTIEWGLGLDDFGTVNEPGPNLHADYHDTDAEAVTTNILVCLRDGGAACS